VADKPKDPVEDELRRRGYLPPQNSTEGIGDEEGRRFRDAIRPLQQSAADGAAAREAERIRQEAIWRSAPPPGLREPGYREDIRQDIANAVEQSERSSVSKGSSKTDFWTHADKAMFGLCEMLALLFGLPFGDDLYHDKPIASVSGWHWFYLLIAMLLAIAGPMWPWIRTRSWVSQALVAPLSRVPSNPYVWLAVLLILFVYGTAPEIYQRATAPLPSAPSPPPAAIPSKPLIERGLPI
jgi:hypothetical protein